MIARTHRFHGYSSLRFVYRYGQTIRGSLISLRHVLNDRRRTWRMAVVVSRKVSKSAVIRNRLRRRIYEVVRLAEPDITEPHDFVFVVLSDQLNDLSPTELTQTVVELLQKAGVIKASSTKTKSRRRAIVNTKEK